MEVEDLATGYTSGFNVNAIMPAASTIKIPVMVEVFRQLAAGNFDLNRRVELLESDRDWGSGDLADDPAGMTFPVSQLLMDMITVSDNTAANMLIRLVGRRNINQTMARLGLRHTKLSDYIRTDAWSVRTTLRTTPYDMVRLLTRMARAQLVDQWSSREMVAILERQEINTLLPEPLPDIPIAHNTGSLDATTNDVGIVYCNEPYAIAVMTTNLPTLSSGRRFIRGVSRLAYNNLERFAQWRNANVAPQPAFTPPPAAALGNDDIQLWAPQTPLPATPTPQP